MTPNEEGFLQFHELLHWLARQELMGDEAVFFLRQRIHKEPLPPRVKMAVLQIIDELQEHGLCLQPTT